MKMNFGFLCFGLICLTQTGAIIPISKEGHIGNTIEGLIHVKIDNETEPMPIQNSSAESSERENSLLTKILIDPSNCIELCWAEDENRTKQIMITNAVRFLKLTMNTLLVLRSNLHNVSLEWNILDNMGHLFQNLCFASYKTLKCFQRCPNSDLRDLAIEAYRTDSRTCEPQRHFKNFSEYYQAIRCISRVVERRPCISACTRWTPIKNVTRLEMELEEAGVRVQYDPDVQANTAEASEACKVFTCHRTCKEQLLIDQCGFQAFNLYVRLAKIEPSSTLGALYILNAIEKRIPECVDWQ